MVDPSSSSDDRGVSPVIGVILMVALTVILATVLGTVVLDFASGVSEQPPQAAFDYEFDSADDNVTITHVSGDRIDSETIRITIGGDKAVSGTNSDFQGTDWEDSIRAGGGIEIGDHDVNGDISTGDTVRIIWENPSSSSANTIDSREWP
ncbi:type IV pilin [Halonotius roseus]|uniref:Type IV pilin n=1 Tax=Halonotius roseus TaxID=2511997 RepID=A0A544QQS2_9EURY|nr:type IV pilin N-terminal domain-containing protein [Halonotius roseus]TQQ81797.1 type IV pilin [Halonotius roseus]